MKLLDFMIVGAQKCGTTALSEFLNIHPRIKIAEGKEVHLFDSEQFNPNWSSKEICERYESFFPENLGDCLTGEATPIYLYLPAIAEYLASYNPNLKLIVILRDPVERAYSQYKMERERQNESAPFWLALLLEKFRLSSETEPLEEFSSLRRHSYRSRGLYSGQLDNLLQHFPEKQLLILSNEELRDSHDEAMEKVFRFLGVESCEVESKMIFSQGSLLSEVPISSYFLRQSFQREIDKLEDIVTFSVDHWR